MDTENGQDLVERIEMEKKDKKKKEKLKKKKGFLKKLKCCKGISSFEIINFLMILCTFINQGLKYLYDKLAYDKVFSDNQLHNEYVDFSSLYLFYETISIFDAFIVFMMALSIIKYTFIWIPSLKIITLSLQTYMNATIKKIFTFVMLLSFAFAAYSHYFFSYTTFGFYDYSYALIRANLLFTQGNLFNRNKLYLADETQEYVFERLGWGAALITMGFLHLFGKYVIQNIIVAFMKKDLTDTRKQVAK